MASFRSHLTARVSNKALDIGDKGGKPGISSRELLSNRVFMLCSPQATWNQRMLANASAASEIDEFIRFLGATGRPHEWRLILKSPPPRDAELYVAKRFTVEEAFRTKVERVPCAVCSPKGPKFWDGYLVEYPNEGGYRLIGNCCGEKHHGENFKEQVTRLKDIEKDDRATNFLIDNLPTVSALRAIAEALFLRNAELDRLRNELLNKVTRGLAKRLLREGAQGTLTITEDRTVTVVGHDGREAQSRESIPIATYPVFGLQFLRDQRSGASWAMNALRMLHEFPEEDDAIVDFIVDRNQTRGDCANAKERFLHSVRELTEAVDFVRHATSFLSKENFSSLQDWTKHPRCPLPLRAGLDSLGRLNISSTGKAHFRCEMRSCITDPIPTLPKITGEQKA